MQIYIFDNIPVEKVSHKKHFGTYLEKHTLEYIFTNSVKTFVINFVSPYQTVKKLKFCYMDTFGARIIKFAHTIMIGALCTLRCIYVL